MPRPVWTLACFALVALGCSCGIFAPTDPTTSDGAGSDSEPGDSELPPPDPSDLAIATFNVWRFFDTVCDSGECYGGDYEDAPTLSQFEYKADAIAEGIVGMQADVVILQEVETRTCLDALTERLGDTYPNAAPRAPRRGPWHRYAPAIQQPTPA